MSGPVLLFDVFRTLLAFDGDHVDATTFPHLAGWLRYRGIDVEPDTLRARYDETTREHLARAPGDPPDVDVRAVWAEVLETLPAWREPSEDLIAELCLVYRQVTTRTIDVWPGTLDMLDACAGVRTAVASNTQRAFTASELAMFGLLDRFEEVVFSSDVGACKPDPTIFEVVLDRLQVGPDEVVYLGDDPYDDVLGASRAGIRTVLLDRGTPTPPGAHLPPPLARVDGDDPVAAVRLARAHLGVAP